MDLPNIASIAKTVDLPNVASIAKTVDLPNVATVAKTVGEVRVTIDIATNEELPASQVLGERVITHNLTEIIRLSQLE